MNTPLLGPNVPRKGNSFSAALGRSVLKIFGWKFSGKFPDQPQMILAVAPHSSNFDFIVAMAAVFSLRLKVSFLAKHTLFKFPLGRFMYSVGGIPVDRSSAQGLIGKMVEEFNIKPQLILGIAPEGTRGKVKKWKRGFAIIAQATKVPILPVLLDYKTKTIIFKPLISEIEDTDNIISTMQNYTRDVTPKNVPKTTKP